MFKKFLYRFVFLKLFIIVFVNYAFTQKAERNVNQNVTDYRIISSNDSYLELEFYPNFNNDLSFSNYISNALSPGSPDVKLRSFPVFLPDKNGNVVEILDAKHEEISNVDINPVPTFKRSKGNDGLFAEYQKDEKIYNENLFYPVNVVNLDQSGSLRNKYFGHINIYPVLYNPVTKIVKKYTYIRVRVTFAKSPVYSNKPLSGEEKLFFHNSAINSEIALNWSTEEFNLQKDSPLQNSILASGDFYKIEIRETGLYKLDKNYLQANGINISNINPRTIKIYGNDGSKLPYNNMIPAANDPVENNIYVSGEEDGQFNDNDYIIFYGKSANDWAYDTINKTYIHTINHYSRSNYYWFTFGGNEGQRMQQISSPNQAGTNSLSSFRDRFFDEPEINNLGSTGLLWLSQRLSVNEGYTFNKELKGYIDGSNVNFRFRYGNGSFFRTTWRLEDANSNFLQNPIVYEITNSFSHINLTYIGDNPFGVHYPLLPGRRNINFRASLPSQNNNSPNVIGYYDYYEVHYDRAFSADNNQLRFNSPDTNATVEYRINSFTASDNDMKVFDVSEHSNTNMINPISYSNGTLTFQANIISTKPREYYAIGGNNYKTPASISAKVPNQNLKGDLASGASFIIISPKEFLPAANRLKAHRERSGFNYIKTFVVDIETIFNEFSHGQADPVAIRNFLKYAYNNWQERPVYVFFFGDGSYDYKNIYNLYNTGVRNWIPPIEKNSDFANEVDSYCSDDYIVEINENHLEPETNNITDFASGRACVNSGDEANIYIDKIISYEDPANFDKWRNEALYIADDGWTTEATGGQEGNLHLNQCEDVAENYSPAHLIKNKVYIVSYPSEFTPQGRRKPGANEDIIKGWNSGQLMINYTGHGSTDLWAHEHIFERQVSIPQLVNKNKYPFVTIASCDLARWDDPFNLSAGEQLVNLKDKGAIGVSAAVRPVYSIPNAIYNNKLYQNIFAPDAQNLRLRLGKAVFNVKQELFYDNDLKFALLCDPSLRIGNPQYVTRVDSINNIPGERLFEMKSLQKVKISGSVLTTDSSLWADYNGNVSLRVLDVDKNITLTDFGYPFEYKLTGGIIYTGRASIVNGKWSIDFVVPRDISYNPGRGKIIAYFKNDFSDGIGYSNNFIMNGIDTTAPPDSVGPEIKVFMDNRNFRSGDMVNQNPKLIADFSDENGINLTGTIGHKIEAILNDDENKKIDLTPFYSSTAGYQNGTVEYSMENLADGKYKLEIKAWDTYNNYSTNIIDFNVQSNSDLVLDNIYNYPNPMQDFTSFVFQHNFDNPLIADIKIYTVSGRLIKELNKTNITDKFVNIDWDGKDSDGDIIANGTYIYKIIIKSEDGSFSRNTTGKLAKLK